MPASYVCDRAPTSAAPEALVLPVGIGTSNVGVLVVGLSRYLAVDRVYGDFFELATAQISRAVANLRAYEQERRRAAELAALDARRRTSSPTSATSSAHR